MRYIIYWQKQSNKLPLRDYGAVIVHVSSDRDRDRTGISEVAEVQILVALLEGVYAKDMHFVNFFYIFGTEALEIAVSNKLWYI